MVTMLHSLALSASGPDHYPSELGAKLFAAATRLRSNLRRFVVAAFAQYAPCFFAIIKMQRSVGENLIVLMTFSREQNDVARARLIHRQRDRLLPVGLDEIFRVRLLQADNDVVDDLQRIFCSRIIVGEDRQIAE